MNIRELADSIKKVAAIREAALATNTAQYGEKIAMLIDGYVKEGYETGLIVMLMEGAPPLVKMAVIEKLTDLLGELSLLQGTAAGIQPEEVVGYVLQGQEISRHMLTVATQEAEENAPRIVVPLH